MFDIIQEADNKQFVMTASNNRKYYGLPSGHAYTLLGALDLKRNGRSAQKLLKIRNPHAKVSYNGPWNDDDYRWTSEFKAQAHVDNTDGIFYMPLDAF